MCDQTTVPDTHEQSPPPMEPEHKKALQKAGLWDDYQRVRRELTEGQKRPFKE